METKTILSIEKTLVPFDTNSMSRVKIQESTDSCNENCSIKNDEQPIEEINNISRAYDSVAKEAGFKYAYSSISTPFDTLNYPSDQILTSLMSSQLKSLHHYQPISICFNKLISSKSYYDLKSAYKNNLIIEGLNKKILMSVVPLDLLGCQGIENYELKNIFMFKKFESAGVSCIDKKENRNK